MKILSLLFLASTLLFAACAKYGIASDIPTCIKDNIKSNKDRIDWYVANVEEYNFQGKLVYAFNPDAQVIADGATSILTSECIPLCQVGGFGGQSVNLCNGENFFQHAVLVRQIWSKY